VSTHKWWCWWDTEELNYREKENCEWKKRGQEGEKIILQGGRADFRKIDPKREGETTLRGGMTLRGGEMTLRWGKAA